MSRKENAELDVFIFGPQKKKKMQNWINSYLNGPNSSRNLRAVIGFRDTPLTIGSLLHGPLSPNPSFISTFMFSLLSLNYLARIRGKKKKQSIIITLSG